MKRVAMLLALTALLVVFTVSCAQENRQNTQEEEQDDTVQIGITFDSFVNDRWLRDRDVFVSAAQELGAEVNVQSANGDLSEQVAQVNYFIEKKMDVIVIIQVASGDEVDDLIAAVARAKKAGIPVICYDRLILNADADLYISFDNEEVGRLMAEHMTEHLGGEGSIIQICGPLVDYNVPQVMSGFEEVLGESSIEIELVEHADEWKPEVGFSVTESYLDSMGVGESLAGIMCGNDGLAGQAIRALSEHRLAGSVCVVGQDADLEACQRIVEGTQCMTVYKPVEQLARRAAQMAMDLAQDGKAETEETINNGFYDVPFERLEPVAVTKENMDEVITGKYHEESDIYRNVRK
ncbi:MAG: substrate-binding domain-containing protein [Lachnospiraceae bacterium]|nr:substrate-binding domain-containing protein [Lachnospiraceae bacterium]